MRTRCRWPARWSACVGDGSATALALLQGYRGESGQRLGLTRSSTCSATSNRASRDEPARTPRRRRAAGELACGLHGADGHARRGAPPSCIGRSRMPAATPPSIRNRSRRRHRGVDARRRSTSCVRTLDQLEARRATLPESLRALAAELLAARVRLLRRTSAALVPRGIGGIEDALSRRLPSGTGAGGARAISSSPTSKASRRARSTRAAPSTRRCAMSPAWCARSTTRVPWPSSAMRADASGRCVARRIAAARLGARRPLQPSARPMTKSRRSTPTR